MATRQKQPSQGANQYRQKPPQVYVQQPGPYRQQQMIFVVDVLDVLDNKLVIPAVGRIAQVLWWLLSFCWPYGPGCGGCCLY